MAQFEELGIDQGSDVAIEIHLTNPDGSTKDLSNHSVESKMKKTYNSDSDQTYTFNSIISSPATDGILVLSLTNTETDAIKAGKYVYDVEISFIDSDSNTIIERVLEGNIHVKPSATR